MDDHERGIVHSEHSLNILGSLHYQTQFQKQTNLLEIIQFQFLHVILQDLGAK